MTKTEIKQFAKLLKTSTQADAVFTTLAAGKEFTVQEAQSAGISDPRRVVNTLRNHLEVSGEAVGIYLNKRTLRSGEVVKRYRMGSARRAS